MYPIQFQFLLIFLGLPNGVAESSRLRVGWGGDHKFIPELLKKVALLM
jgi:hypothetical protein